ncbi:PAC2 family protein [Corynebacterium flavescens]|uniref:Proteasome protein n=1 Tax=Corynebacterium flavescens TaxID=28028 RepID=A0A1L7CMB9_CORFL|nr:MULTISPECIES: PAC2 family protein [Corynebacterium]APT87000.1 proteasome protein [Corynebacterium flavescens]KAA8721831.1 PAC2 family protein [Corynebacterium flavescens]MDN6098839.1 PAC2 family protein [Corynebacterium flavescens]MDN6199411.1 PAC2 family protein [Corynebacterium flavescens]MDN6226055.1 PAC2 family protein [Corynebacterium flavescens]
MHEEERSMYELEYPAPSITDYSAEGTGPTMIVAMNGYADAGMAVEASANHLKAALHSRQLASFNNDELIDYRSRRPAVTISNDRTTDIEPTELGIKVLRDNAGKSFLLLSGPEPDMRWEAFSKAVVSLVEKFDIENTIMLYAAPMPVPHTRPTVVTAHGNSSELIGRMVKVDSTIIVPGSAALFLEKALDDKGRNVAGYTVQVPHYLASSSYPQASYQLLSSIANAAGLNFPLGSLEADIERTNTQLSEQVMDSDEITGVVHQLEQQYDEYMQRYRSAHPQAIMPGDEALPSADELGEEFQAFLAEFDKDGGENKEDGPRD